MKIRDRVIEFRRVSARELRPNPKNWRVHPDSQKNALRGALAEIGFAGAVLCRQTEDGLMILDGHLRAEVAPDETLPCLILDLSQEEADKLLVTHDPIGGMAEVDRERLESLLEGITFDSQSLDELAKDLAAPGGNSQEVVEDEVPEPPADPVTKQGDLWLLGDHRLLCGDATKPENVARLLGDRQPFIMVTDPPYGVEYTPEWRNVDASKGRISYAATRVGKVQNDDRVDWFGAYRLYPGHVAYVWHAAWFAADVLVNLRDAQFEVKTHIIWKKPTFAISRGHYHWQHEPCWYAVRRGSSPKWCGDRSQSTVWDISNKIVKTDRSNHGTQKPIECMARPIRNHGGNDDDVYDPFLGSGTTMIAAEQLGRRCFGIEIEPAYCDVVVDRWQHLTGGKAARAS